MNTNEQNTYTKPQHELIAEFAATYGLEPDQVRFYSDDPQPFFDRDATAVLIHKLTDAVGIEDELVPPPVGDAIAVKYRITFEDGSFASSTGVANLNEKGSDDKQLSPEQVQSLATSRASRSALRNKGIDLVKLHYAKKRGDNTVEFSGPPQDERSRLLREVHKLGEEIGLIVRHNKDLWYEQLRIRYNVAGADDLSIKQLTDFAAFMRSLKPAQAAAA